jgi:probable rRNA maturation factor
MTTSGSSQPIAANSPDGDSPLAIGNSGAGAAGGAGGIVEVFVADEQDDVPVDTDRWLRLAAQVLSAQGVTGNATPDVEMSLYFVDEPAIAALNQQYMGKSGPTDVLSFPIDGEDTVSHPAGRGPDNSPRGPNDDRLDEEDDEEPMLLGDVLICPTVAQRNAPEHVGPHHDGSLDDELALLVVHGILHLLGMDHMVEAEAEAMEARERALLHQFHRPILDDGDRLIDEAGAQS